MTPPSSTQSSTVQRIIAEVDPLSHDMRYRRMVEFGRQSVTDSVLAQAIKTLASSALHYERFLALMSTNGSRDAQLLAAMLCDPSEILASGAVKLAARVVSDETLIQLMPSLTRTCRQRLAYQLWRAGRTQVNDAVYPALESSMRRRLLPLTSEALILENLDAEQIAMLDAPQWSMLAKRMPALVRDTLVRELERSGQPSHPLIAAVRAALYSLSRRDPATGLTLLSAAASRGLGIAPLIAPRYASFFPQEVAAMIGAWEGRQKIDLPVRTLRRLSAAALCDLMARDALPNLREVFPRLHAKQREALYQHGGQAWRDNKNGALLIDFVQALPRVARHAEARHAFSSRLLEAAPMFRVDYLSYLPFEEASRLAQPFLSQPDGDLRAKAVFAVVYSGRYEAASLGAILDFCMARQNEQDPVRCAMFNALATVPPSRWSAAHLPGFSACIDAALRARDCSQPTMIAAVKWLMGILIVHTDFVAETLPRLVERAGSIGNFGWGYWESRITDREMIRIAPRLMSLLDTWILRNNHGHALRLLYSFGCRAKAVDKIPELLAALTGDKREHVARSGLEALTRLKMRTQIAELIPRLVKQNPGWIQVRDVASHLHERRQDLLTPFLTARKYGSPFSSGKAAYLPGFDRGFTRWTAAQQCCYADSLLKILTSSQRSAWELYAAMQRYAAMPCVDLAPIIELARLDAPDAALRDKALEALGRTDAGRGVAALSLALDDARARVAIYALRKSVMTMPAPRALDLLSRVPRSKVTVTKELIRIVGDLERSDAAYAFLSRLGADAHLHPDARIALLRAYWNYLDWPEVWQALREAATSDQPALARATIRIPPTGLALAGQRALSEHLALLLKRPEADIRKETLQRLFEMPPAHGGPTLYAALAAQLDDARPDVVGLAASALLGVYAGNSDPGAGDSNQDAENWDQKLASYFASVQQARSLVAIVSAFQRCGDRGMRELGASASLLVAALQARRWHAGQALRLAFSVLTPNASLTIAQQLDTAGLLHPGVVGDAIGSLGRMVNGKPLHELTAVEASLGAESSAGLRRIGLGLLVEMVAKGGWTGAARQRLTAYQADRDRWVADAADLVWCPDALSC